MDAAKGTRTPAPCASMSRQFTAPSFMPERNTKGWTRQLVGRPPLNQMVEEKEVEMRAAWRGALL